MSKLSAVFAIAVAMCLVGTATSARACDVTGKLVCSTDASVPVAGVNVTATMVGYPDWCGPSCFETVSGISQADGSFYFHVTYGAWYDVNVIVGAQDFFCTGAPVSLGTIAVDDAAQCAPPPSSSADCSPGYYKNHPETWCVQCGYGAVNSDACQATVQDLSARGPGSDVIRNEAKAAIDACFGTAAASPCQDD